MNPSVDQIRTALEPVMDPEIGKSLLELDMIRDIAVDGDQVSVTVMLTTAGCPLKQKISDDVEAAVRTVPGVAGVRVELTAPEARVPDNALPGVKNIIAIGSGKGGVGKSTVTSNLALALAAKGQKVALLDTDIYGPSIPKMFNITDRPMVMGNKIVPPESQGIKIMSMGFFMEDDDPVIWRGPMIHGAVRQFMTDVAWGELDFLLIDLPPGTGDVQLSLVQTVPVTGAVVVSTPQDVALLDARKAVSMFAKTGVEILGIVENMSVFCCPECGTESHIFGQSGARKLAEEKKFPFLGDLPLNLDVRLGGDAGLPFYGQCAEENPLRTKFDRISGNLLHSLNVRMMTKPAPQVLGTDNSGKSACSR